MDEKNSILTSDEWIDAIQMAGSLIQVRNFELAIPVLQMCADDCPDDMNQNLVSVHNNLGYCFENTNDEVGAIVYGSDAYNSYKKASDLGHQRAPDIIWRCAFNSGNYDEGIHYMKIHAELGDCEAIQSLATITSQEGFENIISSEESIYFTRKLIGCGFDKETIDKQIGLLHIKNLSEKDPDLLKDLLKNIL
jgi:TPR repeat protein